MCSINSFVMAGLCVAGLPQTDGGRAADSCVLDCKTRWLHERESMTHTEKQREREGERERIRGSDFSPSLSPSVRRYLTHRGPLHLPYLPLYPSVYAQCLSLSLSLSLFHFLATSLHPSLVWPTSRSHSPQRRECVSMCVCKKDHFCARCVPK